MEGQPGLDSEDSGVKLRPYQHEMLEESLKRNVIIAMDTGSGKTHIAIARIRHALEYGDPFKLVWFMTPSLALSKQQYGLVADTLSGYSVLSLTGADDVETWKNQQLWDAALLNVRVVVGTPAVLLEALSHAFVSISSIRLCVFDEAHRCTKRHPMSVIMQDFYHPAKRQGKLVPHILGLTASPVTNDKANSLETIEANMDAITITPKHNRDDLALCVHPPSLLKVVFTKGISNPEAGFHFPILGALRRRLAGYDLSSDPYVLALQSSDDFKSMQARSKVWEKGKTWCRDQIRALKTRALMMAEELGPSMAAWFVTTCINRFLSREFDHGHALSDLSDEERKHLESLLREVRSEDENVDLSFPSGSRALSLKAVQLVSLLLKENPATFRGIIFAEQRAVVAALAHLLRSMPEIARQYKVGTFVGTSTHSKRRGSLADLVNLREQEQDLDDFRHGEKNLMIATNVLEEGIDVSACNMVICYNSPTNLVSFVQRRGRARQKDSKYIVFVDETDQKRNPAKWQQLEEEMQTAYMNDNREIPATDDSQDEDDLVGKRYLVESTGALLTTDNAKSYLYHFCAVSTRYTRYMDTRPEFDRLQDDVSRLWSASVTLPAFVHPSVRSTSGSGSWRSEAAAIKNAAFSAYVALHKAGLVNDNLLPIVKNYGSVPGETHVDQPSVVLVRETFNPFIPLAEISLAQAAPWHGTLVMVHHGSRLICDGEMWLPAELPAVEPFPLFWNGTECYEVNLTPLSTRYSLHRGQGVLEAQKATGVLLSAAIRRVDAAVPRDYLALCLPTSAKELSVWSMEATGTRDASDLSSVSGSESRGLVRVKGQIGRAYMLSDARSQEELEVTRFPNRRNFLQRPAQGHHLDEACTAKQTFPSNSCTLDNIPVEYALFAAFVPSILHRIEQVLLVCDLKSTILGAAGELDNGLILQAICSPGTGEEADYNRLEFVGDGILKFCTAPQVMAQHPLWPEAYLSAEKDRIVRNKALAQAALTLGLDQYVLTKRFTGNKWLPPCVSELAGLPKDAERQMSTKTLADAVEALIGAAFVDGGLSKAHDCIRVLLPNEQWWSRKTAIDTLHADSAQGCNINLGALESLVGHTFANKTILLEAVTHASFPQNRSGLSYERLEFLGDAVLDLLITPKLFAHGRELRHWEMHRIHGALVNSHILGFFCMAYEYEEEGFDIVRQNPDAQPVATLSARVYHLHDFLRAGVDVMKAKRASIERFSAPRQSITGALEASKVYPWGDLISARADKFLSDMVESVLAALFVDTRGDLGVCEGFLEKLGIYALMRQILDTEIETAFPKERIGTLADKDRVEYTVAKSEKGGDTSTTWSCTVDIGGEHVAEATGCGSREEAEVKAAELAAKLFEERLAAAGTRKRRKLAVGQRTDEAALDDGSDGGDEMRVEAC